MCTVSYNDSEDRIEVQQRIFYDDLENLFIFKLEDEKFDIINPDPSLNLDSILMSYINKSIDISANNKSLTFDLLEYEFSEDAIVIYFYANEVTYLETIKLHSSILFELFDDQTNVVSVKVGDKKKSGKFSRGSKALEFEY